MINQSIKFFTIFLLAFNVFAGGDDRDEEYYEALDEELASFEAQLAEDLANQAALDAFAAELANQTALDAFQQKIADEKAAAAASTAAYQSQLEYDAMVEELMDALEREKEIEAFEAELAAELAKQAAEAAAAEMMAEIEEELARQAALEAFQQKIADEKAAAAASTAAYQQRLLEQELDAFEAELTAELARDAAAAAAAEMMAEIEEEMARQAALEAFQQKLADERAAAAASTAAYEAREAIKQARLLQDQMIKDRQAQLALERELAEFEAQLEADLAAQAAEKAAAEAAAAVAAAEAAAVVAAAEAAAAAAAAAEAAAAPQISLSGSASVSYDDNGSAASSTTYDADITITGSVGTVGGTNTTVTITADVDGSSFATTGVDMVTKIGPVTIAADMHDEVSLEASTVSGGQIAETTDTSVSVTLDVPIGDATIGLDDDGDLTFSGTFSGVTVTHTSGGANKTVGSASIAGMDITITNADGATTWSIATTVSGVDVTLTDAQKITAAFGLAGNTMTVTRIPSVDSAASTFTKYSTTAVITYSTVAISRDLTSGATLTATYSTLDDSLTLKAAVAF